MKTRYLPLIPVVLFSCKLPAEEATFEPVSLERAPENVTRKTGLLEAIPESCKEVSELTLRLESIAIENKHAKLSLRLINPGKQAVRYYGYALNAPTFRQQTLKGGEWADKPMGFCGTGLSAQTLPAGQSVPIVAHISEQDMPGRIGIGLQIMEGKKVKINKVVWSGTVAMPGKVTMVDRLRLPASS